MHRGYIKLWRSSVDNKLYFMEPFTKWQAWQDMLLLTNHKPRTMLVRGIQVDLEAGQLLASEEFLADRWKWSRGKVRRFTAHLASKTVQQIVQQKNRLCTVITIVNWGMYQVNSTTDGTTNDTTNSTTESQQTVQQTDIPKNVKNVKNVEELKKKVPKKTSVFQKPTLEEVKQYCLERNNTVIPEKWFDHYTSNGWKVGKNSMKDWKAAVRTWENNDKGGNNGAVQGNFGKDTTASKIASRQYHEPR